MAQRRAPATHASKKWALSEVMRVKVWGTAKTLVAASTLCVSMIPGTAHTEVQPTAQTAAATKDGRAETGYSGEGYNYVGAFVERKTAGPFDGRAGDGARSVRNEGNLVYSEGLVFGAIGDAHGPKGEKPID